MILSLKQLRRKAKDVLRAARAGDGVLPRDAKLSDALHEVARDAGFDSWPRLKATLVAQDQDRETRAERLKYALFHGQHWLVDALLAADPDLADANLGLQIALFDKQAVARAIAFDPADATRKIGVRSPILHLAFSKHIQAFPDKADNMMAIAEILLREGADVNDGFASDPGSDHKLSALYGALGHANNMRLARWLLQNGASPDDNESLYHSTELGHHEGLDMLLAHGANPAGTNALLRAMDFNDHDAVRKLLAAGADPNEGVQDHPSGQAMSKVSALHQAGRRLNDADMARLLLEAGADATLRFDGLSAYEMALAYGNHAVADVIAGHGGASDLSPEVAKLARIAKGEDLAAGEWIDPAKLPDELRNLVGAILHLPDTLDYIKRLVAAGAEYDRPDAMGVTPVQIAGWIGLPEALGYFLSLKPNLGHVNKHGGALLGTILHGSENARPRAGTDHVECARLALHEGVALPRAAIENAGSAQLVAFLTDWADAHPGQVVEDPSP